MRTSPHPNRRRPRHRTTRPIEHPDRVTLEQMGWRTLLEYRENLVRDVDGTLVAVLPRWTGEAELQVTPAGRGSSPRARVVVAAATAADPGAVWSELLRQATAVATPRIA
jgi:hypothetical protein